MGVPHSSTCHASGTAQSRKPCMHCPPRNSLAIALACHVRYLGAFFAGMDIPRGFDAPVTPAQNHRCMLRRYSKLRCISITSADSLSGLRFCGRLQQLRHRTAHGQLSAIGMYFDSEQRCTRRRDPVFLTDQTVPVCIRLRRSKRHPLPGPRWRTRPTIPPPARKRTF